MNIVAIIQARMGSKRLPGKVMRKILGKPMTWHIIQRLKASKVINEIVIATTRNTEDLVIQNFAKKNGMRAYRGSENDIVDRLYKAAIKFGADAIVRMWGDSPLVDPEMVDELVQKFLDEKADYASNSYPRTFPYGMIFEVYKTTTLDRIWTETKAPFYREFPRAYILEYKESFKIATIKSETDLSSLHWAVDYPEDLEFVRGIFKKLYYRDRTFGLNDILRVVKQDRSS